MKILVLVAGLVAALLVGAYLWSCAWKEKNLTPKAASDRSAWARVERAALEGGEGFEGTLSFLFGGDENDPGLIFVHGTPGSAEAWLDYLAGPLPGYRALAYDRPGFGETSPAVPLPSLAAQARVLSAFLEEKKGRLPILVGHSLGGPIICRAAADFPDRVGGLVVISGSLDPALERTTWYQKVAGWPLIRNILPREMTNSVKELRPLKKELEELEPLLARITCPVLIVHGDGDGLVPVANAAYLEKRLVNAARVEVEILKGIGHLLIWKNQEVVKGALARAVRMVEE